TNPEAIGYHYGLSGLNGKIGFLTFNYLRTYTKNFIYDAKKITHIDQLIEYDKKHNFIDIMLRNETLKPQLLENYSFYTDTKKVMEDAIENRPPRSRTSTEKKPLHLFYNDETRKLVYEKDRFIFEKYNYTFEDIIK